MKKISSLEEYKTILKEGRLRCKGGFNNIYLGMEAVSRYLSLGRIYYELNDNSLILYTDEEVYYRIYLLCSLHGSLRISAQDKPILNRNIYIDSDKSDSLIQIEDMLRQQGFELYDQSVQALAKPLEMEETVRTKYDASMAFLKRIPIDIVYANEKQLDEIISLRNAEPLLKPYHFSYQTREEMLRDIEKGFYKCAINAKGEICAAQHYTVENGTIQGDWRAVKEEYKVKYGIGTAMAYHSFLYAIDRKISNFYGWIVRDNVQSLKYHEAIGYTIGNKFADEWLLTV
ncbi:MAG: hypothetical protein J1E65_07600 [Lachnospiraceae bacterium]|nr:hypothetical protein [Lachnospiraceae bacterium]